MGGIEPGAEEGLVANINKAPAIANAETHKIARPQAWWQNWLNSLGRGERSLNGQLRVQAIRTRLKASDLKSGQ